MKKNLFRSLSSTLALFTIFYSLFVLSEYLSVYAIEDQFTISQVVTSEISFLTNANDVTMNGSLPGVTGGTSYGTTTVVVYTNDSSGYTMTIKASSSPAMQGNTHGGTIDDYTSVNAFPDYTFSVPSGSEFAYSVSASTTSDLAQKFLDNGSDTCNTGSADTGGSFSCWYGLSTIATSTIVRNTATLSSGATTSIYFQLKINPGSFVLEDTYTATTTLTVTTN